MPSHSIEQFLAKLHLFFKPSAPKYSGVLKSAGLGQLIPKF